jgi:hypothetical protein
VPLRRGVWGRGIASPANPIPLELEFIIRNSGVPPPPPGSAPPRRAPPPRPSYEHGVISPPILARQHDVAGVKAVLEGVEAGGGFGGGVDWGDGLERGGCGHVKYLCCH